MIAKEVNLPERKKDRTIILTWLAMVAVAFALSISTVRDVGLDYDEAVYGHLAKDFLIGRKCDQHMPGSVSITLAGRPFPVFVQGYLGAVKCWMFLPSFAVFGSSIVVMRYTMVAWSLLGVLFLILWTRRTLGQTEAILVGWFVVLDPAFFFPTVCEWGAFVPSFFCRCSGLFFAAIWWRERRLLWILLAGVTFGIGFLNKIDFVVFLIALGGAALLSKGREIMQSVRQQRGQWVAVTIAFVGAGSPMIVNCLMWFRTLLQVPAGAREGEIATKLHLTGAVLDGSYFYRLMETGGLFHRMFDVPRPIWAPFGLVLVLSILVMGWQAAVDKRSQKTSRTVFLVGGLAISALGFWLLPDAVRIHHLLLTYPFPHLVIASMIVHFWRSKTDNLFLRSSNKIIAVIAFLAMIVGPLVAIRQTQKFISATGGRGMWSKALVQFAEEVRKRDDLVIASLDWGTHEQLSFLTDGPRLFELTWNLQKALPVSIVQKPNFLYLIHPPEFSLFPFGQTYLEAALAADPHLVVESRTNREGRIVFQIFSFPKP